MWNWFQKRPPPKSQKLNEETKCLVADVEALATEEGRLFGTDGHDRARKYLIRRVEELGLKPYRDGTFDLPYLADNHRFHNVVGVLEGRDSKEAPLLIGAHYDSVIEAPCADDNAAGVAIALETARRLKESPPARNVLFAFFDGEEPPHFLSPAMGSIRFHDHQMGPDGVSAALIMDLVGHDVPLPRFEEALFITGAESHPLLPPAIQASRPASGLKVVAAQNRLVGDLSDHHVFRENDVPYLFLSCGHWEHYHRPTDTPDRLSYGKMLRIVEFLVDLTSRLCDARLSRSTGEEDTTRFEIGLLREALGESLEPMLHAMGLKRLETREDMDSFAQRLQGRFGL